MLCKLPVLLGLPGTGQGLYRAWSQEKAALAGSSRAEGQSCPGSAVGLRTLSHGLACLTCCVFVSPLDGLHLVARLILPSPFLSFSSFLVSRRILMSKSFRGLKNSPGFSHLPLLKTGNRYCSPGFIIFGHSDAQRAQVISQPEVVEKVEVTTVCCQLGKCPLAGVLLIE